MKGQESISNLNAALTIIKGPYGIATGISLFLHALLAITPCFGRLIVDMPPRAANPALVEIVPSQLLGGGDLGGLEMDLGAAANGPQRSVPQGHESVVDRTAPSLATAQPNVGALEPQTESMSSIPEDFPQNVAIDTQLPPILHGEAGEPVGVSPEPGNTTMGGVVKAMDPFEGTGRAGRAGPEERTGSTAVNGPGTTGGVGAGTGNTAKVVRGARPSYPAAARKAGWEGAVLVRVLVDSRGAAALVTIRESSGYQLLDDTVLQAVKKWRFAPATQNGKAVAGFHDVRVRFRLTDP